MSKLTLALLGTPQFQLDEQPLSDIKSRKALALLVYLALTGQPQNRERLAGLLWGDFPEDKARTNLRGEIRRLRQSLSSHLIASRLDVAFDNTSEHMLDVTQFVALVRQPDATIMDWETAVSLYRGPFLDGFFLPDAPEFDQWVEPQREHYRQLMMEALYNLTSHYTQQHQYRPALHHAQHLLQIEPWYEEAHRQIMLLLALDGQRAAALDQYQACRRILADEFGVAPSSATTTLFQQIEAEQILPDEVASVYLAPSAPFQAPPTPAHFVGRTLEIKTVASWLQQPERQQPVALVGMGGMGKTTLAAHLAQLLKPHFADGVLWANAAGTDAAAAIVESWARAFGHDFSTLTRSAQQAAALRGLLADRQALLVFDDVNSAETIRPLLPATTSCQILITTRNHEAAAALGADTITIAAMPADDSQALLARILGARATQEAEAARSLCATLHHLPLAIEIAAQLLITRPRRTLQQMTERLRDIGTRLDLRISDREVRASFAVSWESLPPALQQLFATLGVFAGRRFTAEALAHVLDNPLADVEEGLYRLQALSLVAEEGEIYYRQHPLLADFALERLDTAVAAHIRLVDYYLAYARQHQHHYSRLSREWENLSAAMTTARQQEMWVEVLEFARLLQPAWMARGRYAEALHGYQLAEISATAVTDDAALANTLLQWGKVCIERGEYETAVNHLTRGSSLAEKLNNPALTASLLNALAHVALEQTRYDDALAYLTQSRPIWTSLDSARGIAATLFLEARVLDRRYEHRQVQTLLTQVLTLQQAAHDQPGEIETLQLMARAAIFTSDYGQAERLCQQAMVICDSLRNRVQRAQILYTLSVVCSRTQALDEAQRYLEESIELFRGMGNQKMIAAALHALSGIEDRRGNLQAAIEANRRSTDLFQGLQDKNALVYVYHHRAQMLVDLSRLSEAENACQQALHLAEDLNHPQLPVLTQFHDEIQQKMAAA